MPKAQAKGKAQAKKRMKKLGYVLLFSTDLTLSGREILRMYRARFQIEFLFRDGKSGAGLTHCQSRNANANHNHWNAALAVINLGKAAVLQKQKEQNPQQKPPKRPFSWASLRQRHSNTHFLQFFSSQLGLDWTHIKSHPNFHSLVNYGVASP